MNSIPLGESQDLKKKKLKQRLKKMKTKTVEMKHRQTSTMMNFIYFGRVLKTPSPFYSSLKM